MNFKLTKSSLNFKVYTSPTIPSSGAENDIVIISATPMENWILSPDLPVGEPRNRGDVWIQYSVSGNVFDIMNQHDFMLAITKVYQYVGRTWMSVNARRYVGGVWDVVSSAFSATISITYPANSTCIVTNSIGQTVANDTNATSSPQTFTAIVGATGTYTVTATATDGSGKSKSQDVSIESDGQSISVTLSYELVLFDNGDNTVVTGGWKGRGVTPTVSDVLSFSIQNTDTTFPAAASVFTENKFDLSKYKKLTVTKSAANGWYIGVTENKFSWSTYPPGVDSIGFAAYTGLSGNDTRIELDISGIDTECYVATYINVGSMNPEVGARTYSATLTNITLS